MSLYGVGLNVQVQKINTDLRFFISKQKGGLNIRSLHSIFYQADANGSGKLDLEEFTKGLNSFGFFLKKVDYQCLLKYYDTNGDGQISFEEFLSNIREPLNNRRLHIVLKVFHSVDVEQKGVVSRDQLADRLEVVKNRDYQSASKTRSQIVGDFVNQFQLNGEGLVSQEEFVNYYSDFGLGITSDQHFVEVIQNQWGIPEADDLEVSKEEIRGVVKTIRQRLIQMTHRTTEEFLLRKLFKEFDINKSGFLSLDELHAMLVKLEIPINKRYLQALFNKFDRNNSGTIEFEEFVSFILNDPYP